MGKFDVLESVGTVRPLNQPWDPQAEVSPRGAFSYDPWSFAQSSVDERD
jgi:hypothetical protein